MSRLERPPNRQQLPARGLTVTGFIPSLDLAEWRSIQGFDAGHDGSMPFDMHLENLNVGRLLWRGEELGRLNVSLQGAGDAVAAPFDLPWLSGAYLQARAAPVMNPMLAGSSINAKSGSGIIDLDGLPTLGEELTDPSPPNPEGMGSGFAVPGSRRSDSTRR